MLESRALVSRDRDEESLLQASNAQQLQMSRLAALANASANAAGNDRHSTSILTIIWRRRWVFFGCLLLALGAAGVYLTKATPIYSASSQIYVQQAAPKLLTEVLNGAGGNSMNYFYTQCDVIRSTAVLAAALDAPGARQCRSLKQSDNPVGFLKKNTDAVVGKQSDIITVSVESPYAEDSALLANAVVDSYIDYQNKQQKTTAADFLKILQKEKDKHEQELKIDNQKMLDFKRANGTLSFESDKGNIITARLGELSDALTVAQLEALNIKVLVDAANSLGNDPVKLKQLIQSERMRDGSPISLGNDNQDLWQEYRKLKRGAEQVRKQYGPDHAMVRAYEQQLEAVKKEMGELDDETVANFRAVINQQLVKANTKIAELQKELDAQRGLAMDLNAKAAEYGQLEQDAKRAQNELDMLYARIKELSFSEETPLSINVLEVARPQGMPVKPKIPQTLGIALIVGLMLGLGGSLLQDLMDQRLRSVEEIRAVLDLPVLGIVPIMPGKHAASDRGQEVHMRPRSTVAEAYRTVRTALYFGLADPSKSKTILVTSPSPGDGKTTMASNLAIAIAQSGRKVLLIDADTRKPMMHRIFNLGECEVGLSSVLLGQATTATAIQKTHADGLDILPCGPIPPNPSEILNSQTFLDMVDALCGQYDQIVIDSPPVEPVTDSRILAASCDVTLLVLRAEKSTRRLSAHARDALIGVGANLLGVIVNAVPRGQDGYSYYSGYGYYRYGYGRSENGNGSNGNGNGHGNSNGHKEIKAITVASTTTE